MAGRQSPSEKSALPDVFVPEPLFFGFLKRRARNSKEASPINQAAEQRQNKQHQFTRDDAITKDFFFFPNAASRLSFGALFPRAVQMSSRRHKQLNQRPPSGQFHRLIAVRHRAVCFPFFSLCHTFHQDFTSRQDTALRPAVYYFNYYYYRHYCFCFAFASSSKENGKSRQLLLEITRFRFRGIGRSHLFISLRNVPLMRPIVADSAINEMFDARCKQEIQDRSCAFFNSLFSKQR